MTRAARFAIPVLAVALLSAQAGTGKSAVASFSGALDRAADARAASHAGARFDAYFRKYSKRYFGPLFDWRYFKAQGMAESGLDSLARSHVGARGVMQLMPSTFQEIQTKRPEFESIDTPEWNIAAGIMHDRYLWRLWEPKVPDEQRPPFMFGSYNAGEGTIGRATATVREMLLDDSNWANVETVAPRVPRWRYRETIEYVRKIGANYRRLVNP